MEGLVSLEGCDPELREYLERHRWPSIMEVSGQSLSRVELFG